MRAIVALIMVVLALPAPVSPEPVRRPSTDELQFRQWLARYFAKGSQALDPNFAYGYAFIDLNGDGRDEAIVWARGGSYCGTGGCTLDVFVRSKSGWRLLSTTPATRPPIRVLTSRTHGWLDLAAWEAGGGIERPYEARLRFGRRNYKVEWPADWTGRDPPPALNGKDLIRDATIPLFPTKCRPVHEAPSTFGPIPLAPGPPGRC